MIREKLTLVALFAIVVLPGVAGCGGPDVARRDHIHQTELRDIRLGDGVPLAFSVSIRWRIEDARAFTNQFSDPARYASLVLDAKSREVAGKVANAHLSVAGVFRPEREKFVQEMKDALAANSRSLASGSRT
jgi:regulator of protease activity HflC (stomatin/prohibitin superfamily)